MTRIVKAAALVAFAAALLGCGSAANATPTTATPTTAPQAISVQLADFKIVPASLTATGGHVTFNVTSSGPTIHNFNIRDASGAGIGATDDLRAGENGTLTVELAPGQYTFFCAEPGHESLGMHGTLTVTAP
ncbi:MAG: cupredoxin domain-containing protein [Chloroflexota bacterium]